RVVLGRSGEEGVRVHGRVLSGSRPVPGAILTATPEGTGKAPRLRNAVSREDGSYAIEGIRRGRNVFAVQRADDGARHFPLLEVPAGGDVEDGPRVPVAVICGRVTDAGTGEPLEGIGVSLQREDREQEGMLGGGMAEAQTNAEGGYRFDGIKPGRYTVAAGGPTFFGSNPKGLGREVRRGLQVAEASEAKGVDFALRPGGPIL